MPTIPAQQPHQARHVAESFGADPERYDRARPSYPTAMVERIVAGIPGRRIVDVGIGTGIAAGQFRAAACHVRGVEVDPRMAQLARERGFAVDVAAFEDWDPAGRVFDAIVSGQTWHWIDPVAGPAKAADALRAGGRLAVFWNVAQPSPELAERFAAVYRRVMPDLPFQPWSKPALDVYGSIFIQAADGIRAARAFSEPAQWRFDWDRIYSRDEWLDQLPTHGGHSQIPPAQLEQILAGMGAAVDAVGGSFTMPYATVVVTAVRA
jgi:SAM-dependent methyltransferase